MTGESPRCVKSIDILLKPIDLVFDACSLQSGVDSSRLCHCVSIPAPVGNAAFALHAPLHIRGHGGRTIVTCTLHYVHYAHSLLLRPVVSVLCRRPCVNSADGLASSLTSEGIIVMSSSFINIPIFSPTFIFYFYFLKLAFACIYVFFTCEIYLCLFWTLMAKKKRV